MKHTMPIMKFAYDRIVKGTKRIEMRLFDEEHQKIRLNDVIELVCIDGGERLLCLVRGLVIFERFDDLIAFFPAKLFGYDNKEEVRVRINRRYSFEEQLTKHVVGIFIMPLQVGGIEKKHGDEYIPNERNAILEQKESRQKDFSAVRQQIDEEEQHWYPISQNIEHSEDEGIDAKEKAAEIMRLRFAEGRDDER